MLKKTLSACLTVIILTIASGASAFAQNTGLNAYKTVAAAETKQNAADLKSVIKGQSNPGELTVSNKSTLADYEKNKRQGRGFSTTTKVLIGVGIAVAVVAIIAVVAKNDLKNNILR